MQKSQIKSMRRVDTRASDVITQWLQKYFLSKVFDKSVVNVDKQSQICGVDILAFKYNVETNVSEKILATMTEQIYLIDIKSQINYINRPTNTFALEMEFRNRKGVLQQGWALQPTTQEQYYLLTWLCKCSVNRKQYLTDVSQVDEVEVCLVRRGDIGGWISEFNLDIPEICKVMRQRHQHRCNIIGSQSNERYMWFVLSEQLAEQPISLVIPKQRYIDVCDWYGFVTKDSINRIR